MTAFLDQLTDSELDDMVKTVRVLAETIKVFQDYQHWGDRPVEEWVATIGGHNPEIRDALPALRRTFLLLEER